MKAFFQSQWCVMLSVAILAYPLLLALLASFHHLTQLAPHDPWEAAEVIEGWRVRLGMPLYEDIVSGHSTLMYMPGEPLLLGQLFRVTGPSLIVARLLSILGGLVIIVILMRVLRPYLSGVAIALVPMSYLATDIRMAYFAEARPDYLAWPLGLAGLVCCYRGLMRDRAGWIIGGGLLMAVGVWFKQPVACLAPVPILWLVLFGRSRWSVKNALVALAPLMCFTLMMLVIKVLWPAVFHETVIVPKGYPVSIPEFLRGGWSFLVSAVVLWVAVGARLMAAGHDDDEWRQRVEWVGVCCLLTIPAGALAAAKSGGTANSFIPAWFALITLCWLLLAPLLNGDTSRMGRNVRLLVVSSAFTLMLLPTPTLNTYYLRNWHGCDALYREVLARAEKLTGNVQCPEDPTIALHAKQTVGRNIFVEYDARLWPVAMPSELEADFKRADYIVDCVGLYQDILRPEHLTALGFVQEWSNKSYSIWKNTATRK